jgi:hypothetical protein
LQIAWGMVASCNYGNNMINVVLDLYARRHTPGGRIEGANNFPLSWRQKNLAPALFGPSFVFLKIYAI